MSASAAGGEGRAKVRDETVLAMRTRASGQVDDHAASAVTTDVSLWFVLAADQDMRIGQVGLGYNRPLGTWWSATIAGTFTMALDTAGCARCASSSQAVVRVHRCLCPTIPLIPLIPG